MPSALSEPIELKFGMWGFYHQSNNLRDDGLSLEKNFFEQLSTIASYHAWCVW